VKGVKTPLVTRKKRKKSDMSQKELKQYQQEGGKIKLRSSITSIRVFVPRMEDWLSTPSGSELPFQGIGEIY